MPSKKQTTPTSEVPEKTKKPRAKKAEDPTKPKVKRVIAPEHLDKLREGRRKFLEKKAQEKADSPPAPKEKKPKKTTKKSKSEDVEDPSAE